MKPTLVPSCRLHKAQHCAQQHSITDCIKHRVAHNSTASRTTATILNLNKTILKIEQRYNAVKNCKGMLRFHPQEERDPELSNLQFPQQQLKHFYTTSVTIKLRYRTGRTCSTQAKGMTSASFNAT